ncbi:hypothetical protein GALMADRAFT_225805 [Galerina marginata CBS 339.88]|uniref:Uncharacterized protein n=1 Tax=Galerina marginata (strain CBS 339.88) TaxID=685588 RepID=A0A067SYU9_GALM3|nr:hypothetical protein GALMADRAFT_225805 [Galerina marginata CBS 339.88]
MADLVLLTGPLDNDSDSDTIFKNSVLAPGKGVRSLCTGEGFIRRHLRPATYRQLAPHMDPESLLPLLKNYEEAFGARNEEHMWYHFWSEVFIHLNEQTRSRKQRLSVAPQRSYIAATRTAVDITRDEPPVRRSDKVPEAAHHALPEPEPEDDEDEDMANSSGATSALSEFLRSEEISHYRTPDFSIFQFLYHDNSLTPRAVCENKPLAVLGPGTRMSKEEVCQHDLDAATRARRACRTQVCEQLAHFFADYSLAHIVVFVIVGGLFDVYLVTKENFEAVISAENDTEMKFVFDDYFEPTGLNPHLIAIWNHLSATD